MKSALDYINSWWYHENADCRESLNLKDSGIFSYVLFR